MKGNKFSNPLCLVSVLNFGGVTDFSEAKQQFGWIMLQLLKLNNFEVSALFQMLPAVCPVQLCNQDVHSPSFCWGGVVSPPATGWFTIAYWHYGWHVCVRVFQYVNVHIYISLSPFIYIYIYPTVEKENHLQKCLGKKSVSSQEGNVLKACESMCCSNRKCGSKVDIPTWSRYFALPAWRVSVEAGLWYCQANYTLED